MILSFNIVFTSYVIERLVIDTTLNSLKWKQISSGC